MRVAKRARGNSFEDFCFLVGDDQKADLIDGVIYMASPDNTDANDLFVWLLRLLGDFVEEKDLGKVYGSRVAFRLEHLSRVPPPLRAARLLGRRLMGARPRWGRPAPSGAGREAVRAGTNRGD